MIGTLPILENNAKVGFKFEILDTTIEDFQSFGKRMESLKDTASSTVIGSKKSIADQYLSK